MSIELIREIDPDLAEKLEDLQTGVLLLAAVCPIQTKPADIVAHELLFDQLISDICTAHRVSDSTLERWTIDYIFALYTHKLYSLMGDVGFTVPTYSIENIMNYTLNLNGVRADLMAATPGTMFLGCGFVPVPNQKTVYEEMSDKLKLALEYKYDKLSEYKNRIWNIASYYSLYWIFGHYTVPVFDLPEKDALATEIYGTEGLELWIDTHSMNLPVFPVFPEIVEEP